MSGAIVICNDAISVNNITNLDIEGMTFIITSFKQGGDRSYVFLLINSQGVTIDNSKFQKESLDIQSRVRVLTLTYNSQLSLSSDFRV